MSASINLIFCILVLLREAYYYGLSFPLAVCTWRRMENWNSLTSETAAITFLKGVHRPPPAELFAASVMREGESLGKEHHLKMLRWGITWNVSKQTVRFPVPHIREIELSDQLFPLPINLATSPLSAAAWIRLPNMPVASTPLMKKEILCWYIVQSIPAPVECMRKMQNRLFKLQFLI